MRSTKRRRKHISNEQLLAAALVSLLPQLQRDDLRSRKVPAKTVIRLFTPDHIVLHCIGGSDAWHNLDMRLRGPELKAKDRRDTSTAAKNKRIEPQWREFTRNVLAVRKRKKPPSRWPNRCFAKRKK